jgi:hypothetical protein
MSTKIEFHKAVHGFCKGKGMNTAIMEAKLQMQLAMRSINMFHGIPRLKESI